VAPAVSRDVALPPCDDLGFDNARKIQFLEEREKRDNVIGENP
jgi:hypothetical protein